MNPPLISAADLALALSDPGLRIFDVRHDLGNHAAGHEAFDHGHIPGARYLDHETQLAAPKTGKNGRHPLPTREAFAALMAQEGVGPQTRVVAYDASGGMFADHLWWMLRWLGHANVAVLDGGWQGWLAGNHPVTSDPAAAVAPVPVRPPAPTLAQTVDAKTVLANIERPAFTVLDARAANRYRGEFEPMDPVAGHIPGALNRPNVDNLQVDGRFKPAAALRAEFEAVLAGRAPESIVHQCGSGITASHNLLAMEVAGLTGSRLYPGSWSEWVSDTTRPVATGA
jgi:thiosulfate/3-mercaptopyruvate sulfurtransferase